MEVSITVGCGRDTYVSNINIYDDAEAGTFSPANSRNPEAVSEALRLSSRRSCSSAAAAKSRWISASRSRNRNRRSRSTFCATPRPEAAARTEDLPPQRRAISARVMSFFHASSPR